MEVGLLCGVWTPSADSLSPDEPVGNLDREAERSDCLWDLTPDDGGFPLWESPA